MRKPLRTQLFLSHFLAVLLVSGSIGTYFYRQATASLLENLRARLAQSAGLLARAIDAHELDAIRGEADVARPEYDRYLHVLRDFQAANPDIAFIYVMRRQEAGGDVRFVLDSDSSDEQALPGEVYEESVPRLLEGFGHSSADDEITQDKWGYFLSGYAPLRNGDGRYLVGLDMRADEVQRKFRRIRVAGAISLGASVLLAALFSRYLATRITRPLKRVVERTQEIARGKFEGEVPTGSGDELDGLAVAVNRMSADLKESQRRRDQAMAELAEANLGLEAKVDERTRKLSEVNTALVAEIEERKRVEARLEKAATSDFLTDLLNRPAMLRLLEQEFERLRRTTPPFSIALADLDNFKQINDRYGHAIGDRALAAIADTLRAELRGQDAVARWGGDEILIFMPETGVAGAVEATEKARQHFAESPLEVQGSRLGLTLSIGVAEARPGEAIADVIRRADEALYRAKQEGRNRVAHAT